MVQIALADAVGEAGEPVRIGWQAERGAEQVVLGREAFEEGAVGDAGAAGDVDGGGLKAVRQECFAGRIQDLLIGDRRRAGHVCK